MYENIKIFPRLIWLLHYGFNVTAPENNKTQEGSSFESASSLYSSTKTDNIAEDLVVPCFSPPLQLSDDFIVPNLSSPPLPLPPRGGLEKIEVKVDITPHMEHLRREKTEQNKTKVESTKKVSKTKTINLIKNSKCK